MDREGPGPPRAARALHPRLPGGAGPPGGLAGQRGRRRGARRPGDLPGAVGRRLGVTPRHELLLEGCTIEPLGAYLKSVALLRLVGEQVDPGATGHWDGDLFVLTSTLDASALVDFLLDDYAPTPILDPWNSDAVIGVKHADDSWIAAGRKGDDARALIESDHPRFADFRSAVDAVRRVLDALAGELGDVAAVKKAVNDDKEGFLRRLRADLPDRALAWLDAVAAVGEKVVYTRLLGGSGGNDGRQEYSTHFLTHLAHSLGTGRRPRSREQRREWVDAALFGTPAELLAESPGLLYPGQADMPAGPVENTVVDPWDFVLALEGVPLFASAVSRRHRTGASGGSAPFTVRSTAAGDPSGASGEDAGEFWAPRWSRPVTYRELSRLAREGRCEWQRHQAGDGLDAVRAVRSLGVDRGIDSFVRFSVAQRRGQSRLAYSVGRVGVRDDPRVGVLAEVDGHLRRLRGDRPAAIATARNVLEDAIWSAAADGGPDSFQEVLIALAAADRAVSRSGALRDSSSRSYVPPVTGLKPGDWLAVCDDGTPEVRLAAALAAQYERREGAVRGIRHLVQPIEQAKGSRWPQWADTTAVAGFGVRPVVSVLADVLACRVVEVEQAGRAGGNAEGPAEQGGTVGVQPAFAVRPVAARLDDVVALARGLVDEQRLGRLLSGFLLLDWSRAGRGRSLVPGGWYGGGPDHLRPPTALAALAPFFAGRAVGRPPVELVPEGSWPAALVAGDAAGVLGAAHLRLRMARLDPAFASPAIVASEVDPHHLAAALLVPLTTHDEARLLELAVTVNGDRTSGAPTTEPESHPHNTKPHDKE
ncbi:MAG: type I-U CRISPR-associated protein Csx17 [Deltaproteobacteria bacterium]|nr:MAG: type I-U CRISPR-associated protein Csx17 [Deltaproteobacteria bacterium]